MQNQNYPDYIRKMLAQAQELLTNEYADAAQAAAIGFNVLASFPDHEEAGQLIHRAFRDGQLIRDNRKALGRLIDEWDDRQGYFAESVEVLEDLLAKFPDDPDARRLWAEVRWWRDNQNRIPWIPPAGDGGRFRRTMTETDPEGLAASESPENISNRYRPPDPENLPPTMKSLDHVPPDLEKKMDALFTKSNAGSTDGPVDRSYLDAIEHREIDISKFPLPRFICGNLCAVDSFIHIIA